MNHVITSSDTLYKLSRQYKVSVSAIMDANPLVNVYNLITGETLCIPVSEPSSNYPNVTTYLVQDGDTLGSVIERSGASMNDLMQLNTLNDFLLLPGSTIKVPSVGEGESGISL
jgi:LysM repeat protein